MYSDVEKANRHRHSPVMPDGDAGKHIMPVKTFLDETSRLISGVTKETREFGRLHRNFFQRCVELASQDRHAREDAIGDAGDLPVDGLQVSRREAFDCALGFFVLYGYMQAGNMVAGLFARTSEALVGQAFDISGGAVQLIENARRHGFANDWMPATFSRDERLLADVTKRIHHARQLAAEELTLLQAINDGRTDPDVKAYAAMQISTVHGRAALISSALAAANQAYSLTSQKRQKFNALVQTANLQFTTMSAVDLRVPDRWAAGKALTDIAALMPVGQALDTLVDMNRAEGIAELFNEYGSPLLHAQFFHSYRLASDNTIERADLRERISSQIAFYRRLASPEVMRVVDTTRAIWNHLPLWAICAHRSGDLALRNRLIETALGNDISLPIPNIDSMFRQRLSHNDPQYICFVLFVNTIALHEDGFQVPDRLRADLKDLLNRRHSLASQPLRVALDTFRKLETDSLTEDDAIRDYLSRSKVLDCMVLDVPVDRIRRPAR